ncbi:putative DNA-binding domain-containing protein [Paraburkholderia bengalensis]|uniref:DNA-binding domain-containing protein n=1 Tax=Paraburkholderia bengalensis TaxID=2747562 RepID=A0ABU8J082_9BURK
MLLDGCRPLSPCSAERTFAQGLLDPLAFLPPDVCAGAGSSSMSRYNVYRNNVTVSLIEALASVYPAIQRITGTDFFRAMARFHVRASPPTSPLLFNYGQDFPAFIEAYEFARELPWLADVARIERAWLDAYHAADFPTISADMLAALEPERLGELCFEPHPATRIIRSRFPAVSIFAMNRREEPVPHFSSGDSEDALVTRPGHEVLVSHLPAGGATFLAHLIEGETLCQAIDAAFSEFTSFDLQANLAGMLSAGVFTAINR